jgi:formylglycine-generating enzyme required for sulfatase activity
VFTGTLVPLLREPGLSHLVIPKRVQTDVRALAASTRPPHQQQPAFYDQIDGLVVFKPVAQQPAAAEANPPAVSPPQVTVVAPPAAKPPTTADPCGGGAVSVSLSSRSAVPLCAAEERSLKPKDVFKECEQCPEMVVVPAGSFTMGSPANEKERNSDEGPQHQVTSDRSFAVGRFAVTFEEWDACVADGGCRGYRPDDRGWGRGRRPVINVSWDDAKAYLAWVSGKTKKSYRLLSEAEREYVTRAGTTTPFWWGSSISTSQANYMR